MKENFAADVLDILKRKHVTFRGFDPESLEIFPDSTLKMWFMGLRDGQLLRRGITLMDTAIKHAVSKGDSNFIADQCMKVIDDNSARYY